jgi:hypothetical protein
MEKIAEVDYNDLEFVWVSSHYDVHLAGLCRYQGQLCKFTTDMQDNPNWDRERARNDDDYEEDLYILTCTVYKLSFVEKLKELYSKKKFEWCVGYHWSYPDRGNFYIRKPKWLFRALFNWHYYGFDFSKWRNRSILR